MKLSNIIKWVGYLPTDVCKVHVLNVLYNLPTSHVLRKNNLNFFFASSNHRKESLGNDQSWGGVGHSTADKIHSPKRFVGLDPKHVDYSVGGRGLYAYKIKLHIIHPPKG